MWKFITQIPLIHIPRRLMSPLATSLGSGVHNPFVVLVQLPCFANRMFLVQVRAINNKLKTILTTMFNKSKCFHTYAEFFVCVIYVSWCTVSYTMCSLKKTSKRFSSVECLPTKLFSTAIFRDDHSVYGRKNRGKYFGINKWVQINRIYILYKFVGLCYFFRHNFWSLAVNSCFG